MGRPDTITMSMRELDRCKVIEAVVQHGLMVWRAAEKLGLSRRPGLAQTRSPKRRIAEIAALIATR